MTDPMIQMQMDDHIRAALREDMPFGDVSTAAVMPGPRPGRVQLIAKADGVIAGLAVFSRVFALLDPATRVTADVADGDRVVAGQHVATVEGDVRVLLEGERTALNYLQRMSGIATYTAAIAAALEGTPTTLVCTRKTTPGMRLFEREAVRLGGGGLHRYGLSDGVLLKDNHIDAAGGVARAIELSRAVIRNIKQDLFWALFYNACGIPLAAGVLFPVLGWQLSPMFGAAAMSLSSVCVCTNALRLRTFRPKVTDRVAETGAQGDPI